MSDPLAQRIPGDPFQSEARDPAPDLRDALALCREAADAYTEGRPCGDALDALEELLPALDHVDIEALIGHPDYAAVRGTLIRACADTWFERECELARQALEDPSSLTLRRLFGDHIPRDAYADELAVLRAIQPKNILIIGSGACPMSAIVIRDAFPAASITGMDRSAAACNLSSRLLAACGQDDIEILTGDAADLTDIQAYDCILLALTVGIDEAEKRRIIEALCRVAAPETVLVVRTAAGWGRVLYPGTDLPAIASGANHNRVLSPHQRSVAVAVRVTDLQD